MIDQPTPMNTNTTASLIATIAFVRADLDASISSRRSETQMITPGMFASPCAIVPSGSVTASKAGDPLSGQADMERAEQ